MRTTKVENIRDDFADALSDLRSVFSSIESSSAPEAALRQSAETIFMSMAVLLEGFLSDLLVAYINKDCRRFVSYLQGQYTIATTDVIASRAKFLMAATATRQHLTVTDIRRILDADGDNLPAVNASRSLKEFAGRFLAKHYAERFTKLTREQAAHLDTCRAIRNFLAHRSKGALERMGDTLASKDLPPSLQRAVYAANNVGAYLVAKQGGERRVLTWLSSIGALGTHVCP